MLFLLPRFGIRATGELANVLAKRHIVSTARLKRARTSTDGKTFAPTNSPFFFPDLQAAMAKRHQARVHSIGKDIPCASTAQ